MSTIFKLKAFPGCCITLNSTKNLWFLFDKNEEKISISEATTRWESNLVLLNENDKRSVYTKPLNYICTTARFRYHHKQVYINTPTFQMCRITNKIFDNIALKVLLDMKGMLRLHINYGQSIPYNDLNCPSLWVSFMGWRCKHHIDSRHSHMTR
jgi:hypothetical protein